MITKPWSIITNVCVARRKIIYFARNIASWKNTRRPQKLSRKVGRKLHFIGPSFKFKWFKLEEQIQRKIQKNSPRVDSWKFRVDSGTLEFQGTVLESTPELYESTPTENRQKNRELIFSATVLESTPRSTPRLQVDSRTANRQKTESWFSVLQCSSRLLL